MTSTEYRQVFLARAEPCERLQRYIAQYRRMKGLDPEEIHALHLGTDQEARLRTADLENVLEELRFLRGVLKRSNRNHTKGEVEPE